MVDSTRSISNPKTANEQLFDAFVRHQVYLQRLNGGIRNKIIRLLNDSEDDLARQIRDRLRNASSNVLSARETQRLNSLMKIVRGLRGAAFEKAIETWTADLQELAVAEAQSVGQMFTTSAPVVLQTTFPPTSQLKAIVTKRPFQGRILKDWAENLLSEDLRRIEDQVRLGMSLGEPSDTIARRIVGTARLKGVDGVTQITRNNAVAITRTAVNHVGNQARNDFMRENSDFVDWERFVATLDGSTTPICRANDGTKWRVGRGPVPPLHYQCRSLRVPTFNLEHLSNRPAKPATEKTLLKEFAEKEGIKVPSTRAGLPRGTKGAFDNFSRRRIRELAGPVPGDTTYQDWLKGQSNTFQEDVLGVTKAKLFRDGDLTMKKFVSRTGDELTLAELATKEADAFRAAGLDPADFVAR